MTETSQVWDGILTGDAGVVAPYSASEWASRTNILAGIGASFPNYGIISGSGGGVYSPLYVAAKSPASSNIEVEIGSALVAGYLYQNTAALTFTIGANASGNPRIDTVILRVDFTAQTVRAVVKQGTPAGSPVRPTLQQDASLWEIPLADIAVANGFTVINPADITNRQRAMHSLSVGWQHVALPQGHFIGANYDGANTNINPGGVTANAVIVPFTLTGNMLLDTVMIRHLTTAINWSLNWGLYFEDVNDGNTAENTLRLVATGGNSGVTVGTTNISIQATPAPVVITPGLYWLILHMWGGSAGGVNIGRINGGNFDYLGNFQHNAGAISNPLPQTLNLVTNFSGDNGSLAIMLKGRIMGRTALV